MSPLTRRTFAYPPGEMIACQCGGIVVPLPSDEPGVMRADEVVSHLVSGWLHLRVGSGIAQTCPRCGRDALYWRC